MNNTPKPFWKITVTQIIGSLLAIIVPVSIYYFQHQIDKTTAPPANIRTDSVKSMTFSIQQNNEASGGTINNEFIAGDKIVQPAVKDENYLQILKQLAALQKKQGNSSPVPQTAATVNPPTASQIPIQYHFLDGRISDKVDTLNFDRASLYFLALRETETPEWTAAQIREALSIVSFIYGKQKAFGYFADSSAIIDRVIIPENGAKRIIAEFVSADYLRWNGSKYYHGIAGEKVSASFRSKLGQ